MAKKRKNKKTDSASSNLKKSSTAKTAQKIQSGNMPTNSAAEYAFKDQKSAPSKKGSEKKGVDNSPKSLAGAEGQSRSRSSVSIPGFMAGLFLALVLGIYIGTLLPEFLPGKIPEKIVASPAQIPASADNSHLEPAPSSVPKTAAKVLPTGLAKREKEILQELSRNSSQEKLWTELGDIYFDSGMPEQSIEAYSHSLAINPANPDVLTDMGVMYRDLGNFSKAIECFRNAYAINPSHTQSRYNEGLVLANDLHNNQEAKKAWQELVKISPDAISPHGQTVKQMIEELK